MPVQSFWSSDDKVPISQTKISIPSDNGLNYSAGQRIQFTIPDNVEYINPINTLLEMDVTINLPTTSAPTRLMLDAETGGSVLIRHMRIYGNSAEMPLLEEIQDCNVLGSLRYDYDSSDNSKKKRALTEGVSMYDASMRTISGNSKAMNNSAKNNSWFDENKTVLAADNTQALNFPLDFNSGNATSTGFKTAKLLLPLHQSGIFGSSVVFPNKVAGGLRIELILAETRYCFRQIANVQLQNRFETNPIFHSIDGLDAQAGQPWKVDAVSNVFYMSRHNGIKSVEDLPFCVGEKISIHNVQKQLNADFQTWTNAADAARVPIINAIRLKSATGVAGMTNDLVEITLREALKPSVQIDGTHLAGDDLRIDERVYSVSLNEYVGTTANVTTFEPTYTVSNAKLLVERVMMPAAYTSKMLGAMKGGGTINYDFLSFTNYKYSQLVSDRVANIRVPIMNTRAKGVLCCPVDATVYSTRDCINLWNGDENAPTSVATVATKQYFVDRDQGNGETADNVGNHENLSNRSGLVGIADGLTDYQFFYDGRLNPSRKVECAKISNRVSISQQPLVELEKSLSVCEIPPNSFASFRNNFCIGRAVGLQQGITDLSTTDFNLQLEYQESANAPTKNKLWNIYIGHLRRLAIRGDSIRLEV